jgi:monoamine oxidase
MILSESIATSAPPRFDVAVIGAGLAGLCTAYELKPFESGLYAEAGATIIPDNHDLTLRYVNEFSLSLAPAQGRGSAESYFINGTVVNDVQKPNVNWPIALTPMEMQLGLVGMLQKYVAPAVVDIGDPDQPSWPDPKAASYDQYTVAGLMKKNGASDAAISLMKMGYFDLWGDGAAECGALMMLRDLARKRTETTSSAIKGGNDLLPKAFAKHLENELILDSAVHSIAQTPHSVTVSYRRHGKQHSVDANRVVCTVPFSVLSHIHFSPALSTDKRSAIAALPYTSVTRVYIELKNRFWVDAGLASSYNTDLPIMFVQDATVAQDTTQGILECYTAGNNARYFGALSGQQRESIALEHLQKLYPTIRQFVKKVSSIVWDDDVWSKGDYAWFRPNQLTALYDQITRSEDRIHFAGEHASTWPGWMQGALESAQRVIKEVTV